MWSHWIILTNFPSFDLQLRVFADILFFVCVPTEKQMMESFFLISVFEERKGWFSSADKAGF